MTCPACQGTGLNPARACQYTTSRVSEGDPVYTRSYVACGACEGRGRQTIARVLLDRAT